MIADGLQRYLFRDAAELDAWLDMTYPDRRRVPANDGVLGYLFDAAPGLTVVIVKGLEVSVIHDPDWTRTHLIYAMVHEHWCPVCQQPWPHPLAVLDCCRLGEVARCARHAAE